MEDKCQTMGHMWEGTSVLGWFQCHRTVGVKETKRRSTLVYCNAVSHCPGCVGVRHSDVAVVWCPSHFQICNIEDFPVVFRRSGPAFSAPSAEQQSLF